MENRAPGLEYVKRHLSVLFMKSERYCHFSLLFIQMFLFPLILLACFASPASPVQDFGICRTFRLHWAARFVYCVTRLRSRWT